MSYLDQTVDDVLAENPGARIVDTKYYTHRVPRTVYEETYTAVRTLAPLRCAACCSHALPRGGRARNCRRGGTG